MSYPGVWSERFQPTYGVLRDEVLKTFDAYLNCGILEHGAARVYCDSCKYLRYGSAKYHDTVASIRMAPDLRFVRERKTAEQLRNWLSNPQAVMPGTFMPHLNVSSDQVENLMAFLLTSELPPQAPPAPRPLRRLERQIHYPEVSAKLFHALCFHCHADMNQQGDRGPGNSGGFGYPGTELDLSTYEGLTRGAKINGKFQGLPDRMPDGTPRLVASMLQRYQEVSGVYSDAVLGMPLGFPPIPEDDIDVIYTWIEQGAPR